GLGSGALVIAASRHSDPSGDQGWFLLLFDPLQDIGLAIEHSTNELEILWPSALPALALQQRGGHVADCGDHTRRKQRFVGRSPEKDDGTLLTHIGSRDLAYFGLNRASQFTAARMGSLVLKGTLLLSAARPQTALAGFRPVFLLRLLQQK